MRRKIISIVQTSDLKLKIMKVKNNIFAAILLTALTVFIACEKNVISTPGESPVGARVKFVHACSDCPGLLVTANTKTVNPTAMTYASGTVGAFPTASYAVLPAGELSLDIIRSDSSKSILAKTISVADGKWYTVYIGDTLKTPNLYVVEDDIKAFQDTFLRVRFANLLSGTTKDTLELVHKNYNKVVGTSVTYGKVNEFSFVQSISGVDTFLFRKAGASVQYPLSGLVTFSGGFKAQTYTLFAYGLNNKTTGSQTPKLGTWRNR
jgi:hypothetical protein